MIQRRAQPYFRLFEAGLFQVDSAEESAVVYSLRITGVQALAENRMGLKGEGLGFVELLPRKVQCT